MGGYGSGSRDFRNTKALVTSFLRLDVQGLASQGVLGHSYPAIQDICGICEYAEE